MKKYLLGLASSLFSLLAVAQPYGNEWIDYDPDRYYLKFKVHSEGLYRIDFTALSSALQFLSPSVPITSIDPQTIQVFAKGEEQYIHVEGESDGSFDAGDYVLFFAEANDGWLDARLYPSEEEQTNPRYSLYSDTLTYFITWDPDGVELGQRMTTVPLGTPASTPMSYFLCEDVQPFNFTYHKGEDLGQGKAITLYEGGKGWVSNRVGYNQGTSNSGRRKTFSTEDAYTGSGAPNATIEMALVGVNLGAGTLQDQTDAHHVRMRYENSSGNDITLKDVILDSYEYSRETASLSPSLLLSDETTFEAYAEPSGSLVNAQSDYTAVAYMGLSYPHQPSFEGKSTFKFKAPQNSLAVYLNASDWSSAATSYLYDLGLHRRYEVDNTTAGTVKTNIPAGDERDLYLATDASVNAVGATDLIPVNGDGKFNDFLSNPPDSAYLIISHSSFATQAQQYATYRSLDHEVQLLWIDELYDQFAYGIRFHPLSIRGFCDFALDSWNTPPQFLLLLGKSVQESDFRPAGATEERAQCLVPTMGTPPSDVYLTSGLATEPYAPAIATGRISALTGSDITTYKNKIQVMETGQSELPGSYTLDARQWQKHVLHFAGGSSAGENATFRGYLGSYTTLLEGSRFAGKSFLFSKTSGSAIQELNTDSVRLLLKEGAALMTFFGHAASNTFDLSVDDPSQWGNNGRYPIVLANSCYSGNIHLEITSERSIGEQYVFVPNQGAIAFIATPDVSYSNNLHAYSYELHNQMALDLYGASIGKQMKATCELITSANSDAARIGVMLEMTLHGDPALKVYPHAKSELTINDPTRGEAVSFEPSIVTTDLDSFDVLVTVSNLGRSAEEPFSVSITREFPNGANETFTSETLDRLDYEQEVRLRLPVDEINGIGENLLTVEVDRPVSNIPEFDDFTNNEIANRSLEIISSDITPIYPYNFAVVPSMDVTLKANTSSPFSPAMDYLIQIDTVDTYDSPFMMETTVNQIGAVVEWNPGLQNLLLEDSTVFFWRVTPKNDLTKWKEFSFQVISGQDGWGQAHFFQFKNNRFDFLNYDRTERELTFTESSRELSVTVLGNPTTDAERFLNAYRLDGQTAPMGEYGVAPGGPPSIAIAVIDTYDLRPWGTYGLENGELINQDHQFGNSNNYNPNGSSRDRRVEYWFSFTMDTGPSMNNMINMITNEVPDGFYLLAYTLVNAQFEDPDIWTNDRFAAFEALGADSIRHVSNDHPYIFLVKKGSPETAEEVLGQSSKAKIQLTTKIYSNVKLGSIEGPDLGPSMGWRSFHLNAKAQEVNSQDSLLATALALPPNDAEITAAQLTGNGQADISGVDSEEAPEMRLEFYTEDNATGTPGQLRSWHVLHDPAPEAAINPIAGTVWSGDEIPAGADMSFGLAVENVSVFDFGEFRVHYWLVDQDENLLQEQWKEYTTLAAQDVVLDSVLFNTEGLSGRHTIWMEMNPEDELWHREQYHFNNTAYRSFEVVADNNNPLLDVTFDGIHILNGDIVSPSPEIVMELKDENQFLLLDDTTAFDVFLTLPTGAQKRVPFVKLGQEIMQFEPATNKKNKARVTYRPDPLSDGTYRLSIVGRDASGNSAGQTAYSIEFEVINRSMVTHVMNYPNPFTTSTRFVFTLTGSRIPDVFTVQIMTVTGKVVREITKDELGFLHIGRNITDYAWDGRDEYGDRLANGVYLYRVITKIDGESVERMASGADTYFTKEFGKMYLFR